MSNSTAPQPVRRPTRMLRSLGLALLVLVAVAGCSDEPDLGQPGLADATEPERGFPMAGEAQPGIDGDLVDGDLAGVPLPSASQPLSPSTVEDDVVTQSYEVTATSPAQVASFFRAELPPLGWDEGTESVGTPPSEGTQTIQLTWTRDGDTLLVSIADLDGLASQFSLQLSG